MQTDILYIIKEEIIHYKIEDLKEENINNYYDLIEFLDYDGSLHEKIDYCIDIYSYDLRKWAVDNWEYVERAIEEGLVNTENFDYHKAIQSGQYLFYQEEFYQTIEDEFEDILNYIKEAS